MLTAIRVCDGLKIDADTTLKMDKPFKCPACNNDVYLRKGYKRIHHFYHKPLSNCQFGRGESEKHKNCKRTIFHLLEQEINTRNMEMERVLKSVIPDISGRINDDPVAIEIQNSVIDIETIIQRTDEYTRKGIFILWLLLWSEKLNDEKYNPKFYERYLHDLYKGRIYYWEKGLDIIPYHFNDYYFFRNPEPYFDIYGDQRFPVSYYELSKRYVTPIKGKLVNLCYDFYPLIREYEKTNTYELHGCKLYSDKQIEWWIKN